MNKNQTDEEQQLYDIGSVARLTGLSAPNIRVWEKRHQVVSPLRTNTGRRLYTDIDVQKLTLLKSLIDRGGLIGSLASLTISQLEDRLRKEIGAQTDEDGFSEARTPRAIIAGAMVNELLGDSKADQMGLNPISRFETLEDLLSGESLPATDLLIVETKTLFDEEVRSLQRLIRQCGANRGIVIYHYSPTSARKRLDKDIEYITALRAPVGKRELEVICRAEIRMVKEPDRAAPPTPAETTEITERRFSDQQLAKISQMHTAIECECPQHLSSVLTSLVAFEQYSAECVSRSPEDEALHRFLYEETARARQIMENALEHTLEAEGIEV
ncbi:MAG: MerR family transcriptional regulator [Verrucomicrobiota bacterium]